MRGHTLARQTKVRKSLSAVQGDWWRFDRYEIKDGVIRPAASARLEWYDPWLAYRQVQFQKGAAPPYADLLKLAAELPSPAPRRSHGWTRASETVLVRSKYSGALKNEV